MIELDFTHDPNRKSWISSANDVGTDFPIQNLPFGVFQLGEQAPRIGVAIGDSIFDLHAAAKAQRLPEKFVMAAQASTMNSLMSLGAADRTQLRHSISKMLDEDAAADKNALENMVLPQANVTMMVPCEIKDYTDFYASVYHATNVGSMFRPTNPLLPNYKHIPIGYHGRASSIVISDTNVTRPTGQKAPAEDGDSPTRSPSQLFDYELEVGFFVAEGNALGTTIGIDEAEKHLFGMCLVNDWSARDLQKWEYQPLGPFLAKSFATTVSPWIVTMDALAPFRCPEFQRDTTDPQPLDYLRSAENTSMGGVDIQLEAHLSTAQMRTKGMPPQRLSRAGFTNMYWTIAQILTHHASNGCNLQPGDLMASGTVSGPGRDQRGCLLELTWNGDAENPLPGSDRTPIELPTGEQRKFLQDGDEVLLRGVCENQSHRRIGFGDCRGIVSPAVS